MTWVIRRLWAIAAAITALGATAALAWGDGDVSTSQSGWQWANPQPQGNTLTAIDFARGTGYAAGEFGTLLRTDNGLAWTGVATGLTGDLHAVRAVDADTVVVGGGCAMRRSDDRGETFTRVPFAAGEQSCKSPLAAFHYPSEGTGYVVLRDGTVSKVGSSGGFTAAKPVPGSPAAGAGGQAAPTDVFFVNETIGFVTAGGNIHRTVDGGQNWAAEHRGATPLNGLHFVSATTGYAVGDGNAILKSTDGGSTWSPVPVTASAAGGDLTRVRCARANLCLFSTEDGDKVLRTRDGGATVTAHDPSARPVHAFAFSSPTNAVGVGENGATVFSADAGTATSTPGFTGVGDRLGGGDLDLSRVRATDAQLVHAPGKEGRIGRSTDGGRRWSVLGVPTARSVTDVSFPDADTGYAIDWSGALRFTGDSGATWTPIATGDVPRARAIHAVDQNIVMLFTRRGIYRSAEASDTSGGGATFAPVPGERIARTSFRDFDRTDGQVLFAHSRASLWRSDDRGATWRFVRGPARGVRYRAVDFVSATRGFVLLMDGRVYATRDGGRRWVERRGVGSSAGADIAFGDARNGYITIPSWGRGPRAGWVLRTSDSGASWRPQLLGQAQAVAGGLEAPSGASAFALSGSADLFRTETGGDRGLPSKIAVRRSTRRLRKAGRVRLTVSLAPGVSGARVVLLARSTGRWTVVADGLTTSGKLTVDRRVRRTTRFVAQWYGDADHQGDGSGVATVTVRR